MCGVCMLGLGGVSMGRFVSPGFPSLYVVCFQLVTAHCEMRYNKAPFWFTFPATVQCSPRNWYAPLAKWQEV